MEQGNCVHPHEDEGGGDGEQTRREENTADPVLTIHLEVKPGGDVGTNGGCQAVENDHSRKDGSTTCCWNDARQGQSQKKQGCNGKLNSSSHRGTEEDGEFREAEDITVNELPARLIYLENKRY